MFTKDLVYKLLYFDVETVAAYPSFEDMRGDNPRMEKLWLKRASYYAGAYPELSHASLDEIYKQKAGLEPEFSRVACVSFGSFTDSGEARFASFYGEKEQEILEKTAKVLNNALAKNWKLCGHNIKAFDVPFIGKRMLYNSVNLPGNIRIWDKKPWEVPYIDTSEVFSFGSWVHQKYMSLDLLSFSLGIDSPKTEMDGSMVHNSYHLDRNYDGIKEYCERDVNAVMDIMLSLCIE